MADAKKIGKFVANELLGVDDARRAVQKAKKGDIKGALKSAGAAAFEIGTTATAAGKGGMLAAKAGAKLVGKEAAKTATEVGYKAGRATAESIKPANIRTEGKSFTKRVEGKATTKSETGATSTASNAKTVSGTTPKPTEKQVAGRMQAAAKKRAEAIVTSAANAKEAAGSVVKEALGSTASKYLARGIVADKAIKEASTQSGNVRHRDYIKKSK